MYGLWYNTYMEGKEGRNAAINLFAVEVSKICQCHRLVLTRQNDAHRWFYFFVREPLGVEFGDRLLYYPEAGNLFLERGPTLTYRAQLDWMPTGFAMKLVAELPYPQMYPDGPGEHFITEPPQE